MARFEHTFPGRQDDVLRLTDDLAALRAALAEGREVIRGLQDELTGLRVSAQAMLVSTSWRVTRPVRQTAEVLSYLRTLGLRRTLAVVWAGTFIRHLHLRRHRVIIEGSGLFDADWYRARYPDVAASGLSAADHYLLFGAAEGRDPGPAFDTGWYFDAHPDVARSGLNPLVHYILRGAIEGRHPHPRCASRPAPASRGEVAAGAPLRPARMRPRRLAPAATAGASGRARGDRPWLVCVSHVCPEPPSAGNAYRVRRLLTWAEEAGYRVVLVHVPLPDDDPSAAEVERLAEAYPDLVVCRRDGTIEYGLVDSEAGEAALEWLAGRTARVFPVDAARRNGGPVSKLAGIERTFAPDPAIEVVIALSEALRPDVVLVTYVFMTRCLTWLGPRPLKVVDTIDVFSTKATKVERYGIADALALSPHDEARGLARADVILAIQAEEAAELRRLLPGRTVVLAGVDFDVAAPVPTETGRVLLLIGSDNPLNVRGAADFLRFAWPLIKRQVPDAEFWVAGTIGRAVPARAGVRVLGPVDDVDALHAAARVTINPAVAGTGAKVKTLQSLSRLRPVVCWPAGVDGLDGELREHCDVVGNWYEFAARVVERLHDDPTTGALAARRDRLAEVLGADAVYADLGRALRRPVGTPR